MHKNTKHSNPLFDEEKQNARKDKRSAPSRLQFYSVVFTHKLRNVQAFFEYDNQIKFCKGDQNLSEYVKNLAENQF